MDILLDEEILSTFGKEQLVKLVLRLQKNYLWKETILFQSLPILLGSPKRSMDKDALHVTHMNPESDVHILENKVTSPLIPEPVVRANIRKRSIHNPSDLISEPPPKKQLDDKINLCIENLSSSLVTSKDQTGDY